MSKSAIAALALAAAMATAGSARAQFGPSDGSVATHNIEGITVAGKGIVMARPDLVEIDLSVSAGSELSADAIVKYRDARRKLTEAFGALKLANVAVEERGLNVNRKGNDANPYFFGGSQPNQRTRAEVVLSRKLVVRGKGLHKMNEEAVLQLVAKLLDVAQDAGGHVGASQEENNYYYWRYDMQRNNLARFVVEDFDTLQEEAYAKAIADARSRAERLARLSKVELGPVVAVREVVVPGESGQASESPYFYRPPTNDNDEPPRKRLETSKFQEIPVRVELLVRFDIRSPGQAKIKATKR